MLRLRYIVIALFCVFLQKAHAQEAPVFELEDGDRVVFVGDGFFEYAQRYGYIEAALTARWPDRDYTFRNIGWTGDTVFGEARDHYTNPPTAYEHLIEQVTTTNPTVIFFSYGANLAFEDEAGFEQFEKGYQALLDDLDMSDKRCVLLAPIPHEQKASPLSDVSSFNAKIERAGRVVEEVARNRGCHFIDLFSRFEESFSQDGPALTTNGIHLTDVGYQAASAWVLQSMTSTSPIDTVVIDVKSDNGVRKVGDTYHFTKELDPAPFLGQRHVNITGLERGRYTLADSKSTLATTEEGIWANGAVLVTFNADRERAEQLRQEIIEKNNLYFRKYRPQNETYLVGFRKYEQGQNAVELELLDPLIGEKENNIGRLKSPVSLYFTLERVLPQ